MICRQCPRECQTDRQGEHYGFCASPEEFLVARTGLHAWEEPPISGTRGSGTVFFGGCNLRCIFCQNRAISHGGVGRKMNDDSLLRFVFHSLYQSLDINTTITELLAFIGTRFNVSRVYIFENNHDNTNCSNTFEWCNAGITPEKENLQNVSYITDIPGWPDVYDERGVFYCTDVRELAPAIRNVLEPQGIKSMLHCAIMDRGVFRGYVGFDECNSNRLWTQGQVSTLKFLAEVLAVFLIKQRTLDKLAEKAAAQEKPV